MSKPTNLRTKRKKSASNGFKIDCAYDALVDPETLIPNPRNPNKHPQRQLDLLAKIIKHQGFRRPIIVSNRSGFIIVGHARLEAARIAGFKQVPVDYQDYANEAAEWADMIADNRLAELAEMDMPGLKDLLGELDTGAFDMDLTGFDATALEDLMTQVFQDDGFYTTKAVIPIYEPKGDCPKIKQLFDNKKTEALKTEIREAKLSKDISDFLILAAERHTAFNFRNIAEFYCHSDAKTQELMEKSGLVIIDMKKAIEYGFVRMTKLLGELADRERGDSED